MTLYKITNHNENHHGFQYHDGLNVLKQPFNPSQGCKPGGFYCAEKSNLHHFYDYGVWIREVEIPSDAQRVLDNSDDVSKWKSDKLILGRRYPLFDLNTIRKLNLEITYKYIRHAMKEGPTDFLEMLVREGYVYKKYDPGSYTCYHPGSDPEQQYDPNLRSNVYYPGSDQEQQYHSNLRSYQYCPLHNSRSYQKSSNYYCGSCSGKVLRNHIYCGGCGVRLKWS